MFHLIYVSRAAPDLSGPDVDGILAVSRARNAFAGITGLLLFADGRFIQILEGDEPAVEQVFASIERDARHSHVIVLVRENIESRSFSTWAMGFERIAGDVPPGVGDIFLINAATLRERLSEAAREVKSFIYGFVEIGAR